MEVYRHCSYKRRVIVWLEYFIIVTLSVCSVALFLYYQEKEARTVYLEGDRPVLDGRVSQAFTEREKYNLDIKYVYDYQMYVGEYKVVNEGRSGVIERTTITEYYNGEEYKSTVLEEVVVEEAVPRLVHIGAKKKAEYVVPVSGYVLSSGFGNRWGRNHNGIDLALPSGTPVYSACSGIVIRSEWYSGYGMCVDIDHGNGVVVRYAHLSEINVSDGQTVSQGEQLGLSGNTGNSTGPHLHFEIRIDDGPVNPLDYLDI